jgi:hypothetical protein
MFKLHQVQYELLKNYFFTHNTQIYLLLHYLLFISSLF